VITYPYDPPATPSYRAIEYAPASLSGMSEGVLDLGQQVQAHQGEALAMSVELPPMDRAEAEPWIAWRLALRGRYGYFRLKVDPTAAAPRGSITGSPVANSAMSPAVNISRSRLLYVRSLTPLATGLFLPGDWVSVTVSGLPRLHKNLTTVNADSSGTAVLDIWPALRGSVADGSAIVFTSPTGTFRLAANTAPWSVDDAKFYGLDFIARERLP
jgi:hypothetical protein